MASSNAAISSADSSDVFAQVEEYPWDSDEEFQHGLVAILGQGSSPEQAAELTLRARCFYFARKFNKNVDFDAYKLYRQQANLPHPNGVSNTSSTSTLQSSEATTSIPSPPVADSSAPSGGNATDAPYPTSFQQIVELITSGKPIPGIKDIPPTVLEGQGTDATKPRRKKPWEKDTPVSSV